MKKKLIILTLTFIIAMTSIITINADTFKDIDNTASYAKEAVESLAEKNIIDGTGQGYFSPKNTLTRVQMITILVKSLGIDTANIPEEPTFVDVPKTHWAYKYVEAAYREGLTEGIGENEFGPNVYCSREQMAKMIVNSLDKPVVSEAARSKMMKKIKNFDDYEEISAWAMDEVAIAVNDGIMTGTENNTFEPGEIATREQTAVVTYRFIGSNNISDEEAINNTYVYAADNGFVFSFARPIKNVRIRSIVDSKGNEIADDFKYIYDKSDSIGKAIIPDDEFVRAEAVLNNGSLSKDETYTVLYSFVLGGYKERIIYNEQTVKVSKKAFDVESAIAINISQIKVKFTEAVDSDAIGNINNYIVKDSTGKKLDIRKIEYYEDKKYAIATMMAPMPNEDLVSLTLSDISNKAETDTLSFMKEIMVYDKTAPYVIDTKIVDGEEDTIESFTMIFSEPVYGGRLLDGRTFAAENPLDEFTMGIGQVGYQYVVDVFVFELTDGINVSQDPNAMMLPVKMDPSHFGDFSPKIIDVSYNKEKSGRVKEIVLTVDKDLPDEMGFSARTITAFDKYNKAIYGEAVVYDEYNNRIVEHKDYSWRPTIICFTAKPVQKGDRKLVFPIADGVNLYTGKYTFKFNPYLFWDVDIHQSLPATFEVDFSK